MDSIDSILKDAEKRMSKSIDSLKTDLSKIRTGRAHAGLLDHITVEYYGTPTPLGQVASISVGDARTLVVTPWEKNLISAIEKAIMSSDLGLNPATAGQIIRIPLPPLTEERRKELAKIVRAEGENGKIAVRNIRRDSIHHIKELLKKKVISEDDDKRSEDAIQNLTDRFVKEADKHVAEKEKEIMAI